MVPFHFSQTGSVIFFLSCYCYFLFFQSVSERLLLLSPLKNHFWPKMLILCLMIIEMLLHSVVEPKSGQGGIRLYKVKITCAVYIGDVESAWLLHGFTSSYL